MTARQPIRVGFHQFVTYPHHPGRDGANFAYEEMARILLEAKVLNPEPHDFRALLADDRAARKALERCDVVVSTVGPHAYMYFHIRERLGLSYRIVRDVRTALWNGYLLQETFCAPYLRPGDSVMFPSAFARDLFSSIVPRATRGGRHVCYPLVGRFPPANPGARALTGRGHPRRIGFVGRLTSDKNFPQALELITLLERRRPGKFHLTAIGERHASLRSDELVRGLGSARRAYSWVPPVAKLDIWQHYASFATLFFPSTSSLETFGRVLMEASWASLPVIASSHGPTSELLPPEALLTTRYDSQTRFSVHSAAALGSVDVAQAADILIDGAEVPAPRAHERYLADERRFLGIVTAGDPGDAPGTYPATPIQAGFIARVRMHDLAAPGSVEDVDRSIANLRRLFVALHGNHAARLGAIFALLAKSRHPGKTLEFAIRNLRDGEDFTNIGGIDLQFSHPVRFYPEFSIAPEPDKA